MGKWRRNKSLTRRWQRAALIRQYGAICYLCGESFKNMKEITFDHKVPISKGGLDELSNFGLTHYHCNRTKSNMTPEEFEIFQKGGEEVE